MHTFVARIRIRDPEKFGSGSRKLHPDPVFRIKAITLDPGPKPLPEALKNVGKSKNIETEKRQQGYILTLNSLWKKSFPSSNLNCV